MRSSENLAYDFGKFTVDGRGVQPLRSTAAQVAKSFRLSLATVGKLCALGMPHEFRDGQKVFQKSAVESWLRDQNLTGKEQVKLSTMAGK